MSALYDERLWSEVLNLGGYDLLLKPLDSSDLFRVLAGCGKTPRFGEICNSYDAGHSPAFHQRAF